ncbi:hypothetical protein AF335_26360 [Streptomyces eurocidicus]|uniref:Uncharacterized protein n=1 Tax=Streptomyces eurocidicus TaxID=66423 RepID=A0A2N8NQL2_STREU|nr:hypothetical protein AF335_26360 [Streptomyces eurocidicus]
MALSGALLPVVLTSIPAAGAVAEARDRPAATAPSAAAALVRITEGQVAEARPGVPILYPSVTSCLTVTVRLADGRKAGAHASLFQVPGEYRSDAILAALKQRVGHRTVRAVEVRGAVGAWHPGYFTKAIEAYGDGETVPFPTAPDPDGIARAVADGLGQPRGRVTVQDVPDGDMTVT